MTVQGTSYAAPMVSSALAALRSYRPDLTADQAEQLLLDSAQQTSAGSVLDITALFEAAGLASYIGEEVASDDPISTGQGESGNDSEGSSATGDSGTTTETTSSAGDTTATAATASSTGSTATTATAKRGLPAPRIVSKYRSRRRLYLWLERIPKGVTVVVKLGGRTLRLKGSKLEDQIVTVKLRRWRRLKLRFESKTLGVSSWTKVAKTALATRL